MPKAKDVEPAEVAAIEAETLTFEPDPHNARGDARDVMLNILRASMDWGKLSENQQRDLNAAVDVAAQGIIRKLVKGLAAAGRPTVVAKLEQLTVKDGISVKLTAGFTHDNLAALGDAAGKTVMIVLADASAHDHQRAPAKVDADQPQLPVGEPGDQDLVDAADAPVETIENVEIAD